MTYIKNQMIVKEIMFNLYSTLVIINFINFPIFIMEEKKNFQWKIGVICLLLIILILTKWNLIVYDNQLNMNNNSCSLSNNKRKAKING